MFDTRLDWMSVRVVESGKDGPPRKIYLARARSCQAQNVFIRPNGKKPALTDRHGLRSRLGFIYGRNISVIQNDFRLFSAQKGQYKQAAHVLEKIPTTRLFHWASANSQCISIGTISCSQEQSAAFLAMTTIPKLRYG